MQNTFQRLLFLLLGFIFCFFMVGCGNKGVISDYSNPKDSIGNATNDVDNSAQLLKDTTDTIKAETNQINLITPDNLKKEMSSHTLKIWEQTIIQDGIISKLFNIKKQLTEADSRVSILQEMYEEEKAARIKAEENVTKEFREKIMGWSAFCFFGVLICAGIAIFSQGNKLAIYGGIVCAIGLAVCVLLVQTIALIPYFVIGISVLAIGIFVYVQFFKDRKSKTLSVATKELIETVEGQKPLMSIANRQFFFGDGPVPGTVRLIQSDTTKDIVDSIRSNPLFKRATPIVPSQFIDLNNDGIEDSQQAIKNTVADIDENKINTKGV